MQGLFLFQKRLNYSDNGNACKPLARGALEPAAGVLAAALYFWQMPHFMARRCRLTLSNPL